MSGSLLRRGGNALPASPPLSRRRWHRLAGTGTVATGGTQAMPSAPLPTSTSSGPTAITPAISYVAGFGSSFTRTFPADSVTVLELPVH
jgi:hypothetical protein